MPNLEDVFRLSGVPTYTFVAPDRYNEIAVSVRTPGRCVVLEGPSGIGKTTTITKVLSELQLNAHTLLSARRPNDVEIIKQIPQLGPVGIVIVDDFHRLDDDDKSALSDYMKYLADVEDIHTKLVLIGINKAGQQLITGAPDAGLRIDIFRLGASTSLKIVELIQLGEKALRIDIPQREVIAERAQGSLQIAQLLCHKLCTFNSITVTQPSLLTISTSIEVIIENVITDLSRIFRKAAEAFARGSKIRREGRAPYLHILKWLSETEDGALDIRDAMNLNPDLKASVGQVLEKGFLRSVMTDPQKIEMLESILYFEEQSNVIAIEDPKFLFYLKNIVWRAFTKQCGFTATYFTGRYDFAISFAGHDRIIAEELVRLLQVREVNVFYDFDEQHEIIGRDLENYLAPIYRSEANYIIAILSPNYPTKIWTKFESENFKDRFGDGAVIPVQCSNVQPGFFSIDRLVGSLSLDLNGDISLQLASIADTVCRRLVADREAGELTL